MPLILLAIPSLVIGWLTVGPVLFGDYFGGAISVLPAHDVLGHIGEEFHGPLRVRTARVHAAAGVSRVRRRAAAWYLYIKRPDLPGVIASTLSALYKLLANKFYFDEIYQAVFAGGSRGLGTALWRVGDVALIDGAMVNGSARVVGWLSGLSAPHAVGLSVSLRVRDDHRIVRAARVVRAAVTRIERSCSWTGQYSAYSSGCRSPAVSLMLALGDRAHRARALGRAAHDRRDVRHLDAAVGALRHHAPR